MQSLLLLLVFFGTALLVLGTYAFINRRRLAASAALRERLGTAGGMAPVNILRDQRRSSVAFVDRLLDQSALTPGIEGSLKAAGAKWSAGEFVLGSAVTAAVLLLIGQQWGQVIGLLFGAAGLAVPLMLLGRMRKRRARKFEEQLPDAIDMIVNAMRAGFSFQTAMKFVGDETPAPLGEEFMRVYDEQRLGADVRSALLDLQERVGTLDAKMLVTSLLIQRETGGNLSEILSGLSSLIRQRGALRGQIDTLTAEPKFAGRALALMPVAGFFALLYLDRALMMPMLTTSTGRWLLTYAAGSIIVGYVILMKIADIEY